MGQQSRIAHLDGLRGVAIIAVILYHTFNRWPGFVPWGSDYAFFGLGWLGVQLFFLISGYVILMTLEKTSGRRDFIWKRWLRLFPAMAICTALLYLTAPMLDGRPEGQPTAASILPGLTFIDPHFWGKIGIHSPVLEGAFWSIYVEWCFYIFACLAFFWRGPVAVVIGCAGLYALAKVALLLGIKNWYTGTLEHFGWFSCGAAFYLSHADRRWWWPGVAGAVLCALLMRPGYYAATAGALAVVALWLGAMHWQPLKTALSSRWLVWVGFISYPLYLLHQNLGIALIHELEGMGHATAIMGGLGAVVVLAWAVAKFEPVLRRALQKAQPVRAEVADDQTGVGY